MTNEQMPKIDRRSFMQRCARTAPAWYALLASAPLSALAQDETPENGYKPEDHNYAMGVDVEKCIGCARCVDACKKENKVPREPIYFRTWVERYVIPADGEAVVDSPNGGLDGYPEVDDDMEILRSYFVPKLCNHCSNPPCVQVCPVGATFISPDGVVLVDATYCVGCRYCIQACPYGARYMHPETDTADKCTFCYHRITKGLLPACVEVCPTQARIFGELGDRSSPLRRFQRFKNITVLKPGLNTKPKVLYSGADGEVR